MLKSALKLGGVMLLAAALVGAPGQVFAQTTNKAVAQKKAPVVKKDAAVKKDAGSKKDAATKPKSPHPFHGKLAAVDQVAKTITCGKSVYQITSQTKIIKDGQPATLAEGVVGEPVSGYVVPAEGGKMAAKSVRFGPKPEAKVSDKKKGQ